MRIVKKPVKKEQVKHFDFNKKPQKPCFLIDIAKHLISFPDLKKRNAKLTRTNMEDLDGKPYILLVTHSSMVDFHFMLKATHPQPVNNVMTIEGFETYTEPLMRALGVLGKRKYVQDFSLIRNIKYCLHDLKTVFVLFPEARYSLDGTTSFLPRSLGGLVKMMKVPVAVLRIHGNFVTHPQWNKIEKGSYAEAEIFPILTEEEAVSLSKNEIFERIEKAFQYDDFAWQKENRILIDHPRRAEGLHSLLYKCPHCLSEGKTDSSGAELFCTVCNKRWRMTEYGELQATDGKTIFSHIPDWSRWERECVKKEIEDGSYFFEDEVRLETIPGGNTFYAQGTAKFTQNTKGTFIEGTCYKEPFKLHKKPLELECLHIEYDYLKRGDCVEVSVPDDSYWCYFLNQKNVVTKLSFATEELYLKELKQIARTL